MDPETAHGLTIQSLRLGLYPRPKTIEPYSMRVKLWGLEFPNPVGLAAGFDKNAAVIAPILNMGFGFTEVGTVTPKPQAGNPRPRVFRDTKNQAVINRMGFPNQGLESFKENIKFYRRKKLRGIVGLNIGMNKDQTEPALDYTLLIKELGLFADYFTINISSPNTPGLRNLQSRENLMPLIEAIKLSRKDFCNGAKMPAILVKLAPDLTDDQQIELAQAAIDSGIDGLILTNTTLERPDLLDPEFKLEKGGLSGAPVRDKSTAIIHNFYKLTKGKIPIIGAGGISSAQDAYDKIKAGASLVQLYSALVFQGPSLPQDINQGLIKLIKHDGFEHITQAIGAAHK